MTSSAPTTPRMIQGYRIHGGLYEQTDECEGV
jgi:hypothetical protein